MAAAVSPVLLRSRRKKARAHLMAGEWETARRLLHEICAADSRDAEAWFLLGALCGQLNQYDEAISHTHRAIAIRPDFGEAWYNLAQAHMHARRYREAVEAYRACLRLNPGNADAHNALGLALDWLGHHDQSFRCFQEATRIRPELADAWHNAGNAALAVGDRDAGIRYLRHAIHLRPERLGSHICLGFALALSEALDEATAVFESAQSLDVTKHDATYGRAFVCERRGEFAKAWEILRPFYESGCRDERFLLVFSKIARHVGMHAEAAGLLEKALQEGRIAPHDVREAHFSLGKLYDELRDYDKAFPHFARANVLKNAADATDPLLAAMHRARGIFTRDFFRRAPRATIATDRPIFIVGMPRSGTTLTEQTLASHPLVAGAGELTEIGAIEESLEKELRIDGSFPERATAASVERLNLAATRYLARLSEASSDARYVTDKMPHNFVHLGLIALLFPQARIVHCHRNPMDNCLSIFTYDFNSAHPYATDLSRLGEHYRGYRALMQHWREHLPLPIFDLRYEDMVADQEATCRALLDFCGLPWDARCLRFHENKRIVRTFSYNQVRQPIYRRSVERWRNYERFLDPLLAALGPDADPLPAGDGSSRAN